MFFKEYLTSKKGVSVIEILIVSAIIVVGLVSLLELATFSLKLSIQNRETTQAKNFAEETLEAVRNFRDGTIWDANGLGILSLDTVYHLEKTGDTPPKWDFVLGEEEVNGFKREVVLNRVFRDADSNIAASGTEDPNTKKITATVSWKDKELEIINYLTNWR